MTVAPEIFIGLMSGTSADGVDGVVAQWKDQEAPCILAHGYEAFDSELRQHLLALNQPGPDELARAAYGGSAIARCYARVTQNLIKSAGLAASQVRALGAHGQTVRHRPGPVEPAAQGDSPTDPSGYTLQLLNGALLAELSGIDVVCDFRSADVAAGGQGAPLVPAVHRALFSRAGTDVAVLNLGGIANLSLLPSLERQQAGHAVLGFDSGPGNALLDLWCERHGHGRFDAAGQWGATGQIHQPLLAAWLAEPYFSKPAPKSTGRDLFDQAWLDRALRSISAQAKQLPPQDVQATLTELTARTVAAALLRYSPNCQQLLICGGGALNDHLIHRIRGHLPAKLLVQSTAALGLPVDQVEAFAFAWLAHARVHREPGNLPAATGAAGPRILGAIYAGTAAKA